MAPINPQPNRATLFGVMQQVKTAIPNIPVHDFVKLVAIIAARTHGQFQQDAVNSNINEYKSRWQWEQKAGANWTGTDPKYWQPHVNSIIRAALQNGKKSWVTGFTYTGPDLPGTSGPNFIQRGADAVPNSIVSPLQAFSHLASDLTDPHFWLRLAEGTAGLILVAIAVNKMFNLNVGQKVKSLR